MKSIGVFFGSRSPEHDVSIVTAELIISELKKMGYPVVPVYLSQTGGWHIAPELGSLSFFTKPDFNSVLKQKKWDSYYLDLKSSHGCLVFKEKKVFGKEIVVDVAFPALHGAFGEDGTIQGLFELCDVPYVGCGVAASAIAMDKILTKDVYTAHAIPTTSYLGFTALDWETNKNHLLKSIRSTLHKSVFVKPAKLGSSIGISKVGDSATEDLEFKIEVALHYDDAVIVENAVPNVVDLTCCVIGSPKNLTASLVQESVFQNDLFDFNEKYLEDGGAQLGQSARGLVIPAKIPADVTQKIQAASKDIFKIIGASGIARVDWLYDRASGSLYANEINPLPGTMYHHLWKASGVSLESVLFTVLDAAAEKNQAAKRLTHIFPSKLLNMAGSMKLPKNKLQ